MLIVDKAGNLQISPKWIETFIINSDNHKKKCLSFLSHIGSDKNNMSSFINTIFADKIETENLNEINCHIDSSNYERIHLSYCFEDISLDLIRNLKFMFSLSEKFLIYLKSNEIMSIDSEYLTIIESLFIFIILDSKLEKKQKITLTFVLTDNYSKIDINIEKKNLMEKLEEIWKKCLKNTGCNENNSLNENLMIEIVIQDSLIIQIKENNIEDIKKTIYTKKSFSSDSNNIIELINKKWIDSQKISNILLLNIDNQTIKNQITYYFADFIFYKFIQLSNQIFNKWNKVICRGKIIKNYGTVLSNFFDCILKQYDQSIPENLEKSVDLANKKTELIDFIQEKASFFFTRQLLNLQSQALEKFKDILLKSINDPKNSFETIKKFSIENINNWFILNAETLSSNCISLSFYNAQKELNAVLLEFAEKFKDSPVIKLQSLQRLEKQTSVTGLKQSGIVIGFGLTAAFRPSGFGNFQLITSYTQGPHIFNFSLVNDKDVAEQEGQGKIKTFRIQPSLSFDIEL